MNKNLRIGFLVVLLLWFFLDMTGLRIAGNVLVTSAYKEDGVFFVLYVVLLVFYLLKPKVGSLFLTGWLFMWLLTQFFSHWFYMITGASEEKINYFSHTIKLIDSSNIYIPDLYHIILHILILISLINMVIFIRRLRVLTENE